MKGQRKVFGLVKTKGCAILQEQKAPKMNSGMKEDQFKSATSHVRCTNYRLWAAYLVLERRQLEKTLRHDETNLAAEEQRTPTSVHWFCFIQKPKAYGKGEGIGKRKKQSRDRSKVPSKRVAAVEQSLLRGWVGSVKSQFNPDSNIGQSLAVTISLRARAKTNKEIKPMKADDTQWLQLITKQQIGHATILKMKSGKGRREQSEPPTLRTNTLCQTKAPIRIDQHRVV